MILCFRSQLLFTYKNQNFAIGIQWVLQSKLKTIETNEIEFIFGIGTQLEWFEDMFAIWWSNLKVKIVTNGLTCERSRKWSWKPGLGFVTPTNVRKRTCAWNRRVVWSLESLFDAWIRCWHWFAIGSAIVRFRTNGLAVGIETRFGIGVWWLAFATVLGMNDWSKLDSEFTIMSYEVRLSDIKWGKMT